MSIYTIKSKLKAFKEDNSFEFHKVTSLVHRYAPKDGKILDVGCGYGRYLKPLSKKYKETFGVEVNTHIVNELRKEGLKAYTPKEFAKNTDEFDIIIMSHIIEHFSPTDLLNMMDSYLDKLKTGGHLIIATPVLTEKFYIDFDHVRPYYPQSIEEVFSVSNEQVQYYSRNKLETSHVAYRRSRLQITNSTLLFNNKHTKAFITGLNLFFAILFRISFSLIGYKSGWIGAFKKVSK